MSGVLTVKVFQVSVAAKMILHVLAGKYTTIFVYGLKVDHLSCGLKVDHHPQKFMYMSSVIQYVSHLARCQIKDIFRFPLRMV